MGGAILDRDSGSKVWEAFGGVVPGPVVSGWNLDVGHSKVIHQAELYPAQLALEMWAEKVRGRRVVLFVDNDAARGALIKGLTRTRPSARIVSKFWEAAARSEVYLWVDRVPSAANPADGPSRGSFAWFEGRAFTRRLAPGIDAFS